MTPEERRNILITYFTTDQPPADKLPTDVQRALVEEALDTVAAVRNLSFVLGQIVTELRRATTVVGPSIKDHTHTGTPPYVGPGGSAGDQG